MIFSQNKKAIFIIIIFLIFPVVSGFKLIPDTDGLINSFYSKLFNFSFHQADSIVSVMDNSGVDPKIISNIKANFAWWKILTGDDVYNNLEICNNNLASALKLSHENDQTDLNSLLNTIFAYSLKARIENHMGNRLKSLISFYKSIDSIEKCSKIPTRDEKLRLVLGLYYYFNDYFKEEYSMFSIVFLSPSAGDRSKGISYLEESSASQNVMVRTEANYFLMKIYSDIEKNYPKALKSAQVLTREYPNNLVFSLEQLKLMLILKSDFRLEYREKLLGRIESSRNLNDIQRIHFIGRIGEIGEN